MGRGEQSLTLTPLQSCQGDNKQMNDIATGAPVQPSVYFKPDSTANLDQTGIPITDQQLEEYPGVDL